MTAAVSSVATPVANDTSRICLSSKHIRKLRGALFIRYETMSPQERACGPRLTGRLTKLCINFASLDLSLDITDAAAPRS